MAVRVFLDTSVLLAGLVDFGPQSAPAQSLLHAVAEKQLTDVHTAWHCCLELFSVSTRLPPEFRLAPTDAARLIDAEVFARMTVHDLPAGDRLPMLKAAAHDGTAGGRVYDAHIAEIARAAGASVIVTDNRRHFMASLRHGIRVDTPAEFLTTIRQRRP
ncbi:MAG: type II toxin-antitoxin system VapC family toxin [Acidimicrobiia bacterium]|nr:type II toxin-antitoxin system VapC family toxin [Acidimicrobiia bacterium]